MKRGKAPTAVQKRFHSWLALQGCMECGKPPELHHAVGSTGSHNKVKIGQWWVIPLCAEHHRGITGIHSSKNRKSKEKQFFRELSDRYEGEIPENVILSIESYHR